MSGKLPLAIALASLACLAIVPTAGATGLQGQRVVSQPDRLATASTLIASQADCPGQNDLNASAAAQEQAMLCMTEFARAEAGLGALSPSAVLEQSAADKSGDVLRCDSFSHFACGREFTYWMKETGYTAAPCWHVGENLAWGTGDEGTVHSIFEAWMHSPGHRANILGDYAEVGMSVRAGTLEGNAGTRVWAQHFGSRCDDSAS